MADDVSRSTRVSYLWVTEGTYDSFQIAFCILLSPQINKAQNKA